MYFPVTSWLRASFALQQCALDGRGDVEIPNGDDEPIRWPRTTGADVIAIASVLDPHVREQPLRFGGHGLAQRWRATVDDLERLALLSPRTEYPKNRAFWDTLPAICVYLHSQGAPFPPAEVWNALCAQLTEPAELRNVGPKGDGPFKHFDNVKTFDDLYLEQFKYLRDLRGFDKMKPDPGTTGPEKIIPRSTNGDVVELADYWTRQLGAVKRVMGHDGVAREWQAARADVDHLARSGDPNAVYPKNNAFWRALQKAAIHVAVADEAPTATDLAIEALKQSVTNLPDNLKAGAKAIGSGAAQVASDLAHGVGKVANEAGKGLFKGFGTPLLVGAGVVGALLIARSRKKEER